jgi:hypothetical protein
MPRIISPAPHLFLAPPIDTISPSSAQVFGACPVFPSLVPVSPQFLSVTRYHTLRR